MTHEHASDRGSQRRRLQPWLAAWLLLTWTLLQGHWALGSTLLGLGLALWLARRPAGTPAAEAQHAPLSRRLLLAPRFAARVLWDIVVSNLQVARRLLGSLEGLQSGEVWVPLDLTQPRAIGLLAAVITMTPGTLSCGLSEDGRQLRVHALELDDPEALIAQIKTRYEAPIRELLE